MVVGREAHRGRRGPSGDDHGLRDGGEVRSHDLTIHRPWRVPRASIRPRARRARPRDGPDSVSRAANLKSNRYPPSHPLSRRWEFCAPHYYDFEVGDAADAQPDAWFDSAQTAGLKTPVALLDKAQTNAAAKQAAAEVTAEQAKENPPSAVKSAAKAARTPVTRSTTTTGRSTRCIWSRPGF